MATIKQEVSDEVKTETNEANIKMETTEPVTKVVVKTEPNEEKMGMDTSDGPNNEKTETDAANGKLTTSINVNSNLDDKIIRQIEYYFGDYNLPKDKFLKEQIELDDGWIPIATMLKFARLSQLTNSPQVIFAALKKSTLMEVNENSAKLRRSKEKPIPLETPEYLAEVRARTIYCKGLPKEYMTIDKLLEFFKSFPTVLNIKMRYFKSLDDTPKFKGSINVTFSTREEAAQFISLESVKYNDYTLQRQWSAEWEKEKEQEYEERQKRKVKKEKNTDENGNGHKGDDKGPVKNEKIVLSRGTVLKLVNLPSGIDRDVIKQAFATYPADIAHIEITPESTAFVRLRGENDGKLVLDKLTDKKINVNDSSVEVSLLDGEEEENYLKKAEENVNNRVNMGRGGFGRGRGRGRGGRGGGRGGYKGKDRKREGSNSGAHGEGSAKRSRDD